MGSNTVYFTYYLLKIIKQFCLKYFGPCTDMAKHILWKAICGFPFYHVFQNQVTPACFTSQRPLE